MIVDPYVVVLYSMSEFETSMGALHSIAEMEAKQAVIVSFFFFFLLDPLNICR